MGRFEIILWDVDQTLLDFNKSQEYALRYSFGQFGLKADPAVISLYSDINSSYWKRYELGEITKEKLLTGRFASLFERLGMEDMNAEEFQPVYQKALGSVFYFRDDSRELCRKLKGRVRQYALTNGVTSTQQNKLRLSGLDRILDGIFISEEIGYPKPERRYFEKCFRQIPDFSREKALMVGDSLSATCRREQCRGCLLLVQSRRLREPYGT